VRRTEISLDLTVVYQFAISAADPGGAARPSR
jgi:hypothetical protein